MSKGEFKGNISAKGKGLDNNPQNINRKGRPKKTVGFINDQLKKEGYPAVSKDEIVSLYLQVCNLDKDKLKELKDDDSKPLLLQVIVKHILSNKGFDVIEKMFDRALGKPIQSVKQDMDVNIRQGLSKLESDKINKTLKDNGML